jgi:hypothetical protein
VETEGEGKRKKGERKKGRSASLIGRQNLNSTLSGPVLVQQEEEWW